MSATVGPGRSTTDQGRSLLRLTGAGVVLAALILGPALAGHLVCAATGRGRPATPGVLWSTWMIWTRSPRHPLAAWPIQGGPPAAWLFWTTTGLLILIAVAVAAALTMLAGKIPEPPPAGLATAAQERQSLTAGALIKMAPEMRPQLTVQVATRDLRPEQLGFELGKSVATRQHIFRPIESSTIVLGLSGSGKTASVVIPAILDYDSKQVVSTTKTDILAATWHASMERGGVRTYDPLGLSNNVFPTVQYTPVAGCDDPDIAENRTKVLTFRPAGPDPNAQFRAEGERVVRALLHAAALSDSTVSELLAWVYNPLDSKPEQIIRESGRGYSMFADELAAVRKSPDKQREGSYLSVREAFNGLSSPRVLRTIDWRPSRAFNAARWLIDGTESLYLMTHRTQVAGATKVVSLMVADILDAARLRASASIGGRLDPPLPIVNDEFLNSCRLNDWETTLADSRGWGIHVTAVTQSRAMIRSAYGRDEGDGIWEAAGTRVMVGGGTGGGDTKELAEVYGRHDVTTFTKDLRGNGGSISTRRDDSRTTADIRNMAAGRAIVLASQTPPIEVRLRPWWQRPDADAIRRARALYEQHRSDGTQLSLAAVLDSTK